MSVGVRSRPSRFVELEALLEALPANECCARRAFVQHLGASVRKGRVLHWVRKGRVLHWVIDPAVGVSGRRIVTRREL